MKKAKFGAIIFTLIFIFSGLFIVLFQVVTAPIKQLYISSRIFFKLIVKFFKEMNQ